MKMNAAAASASEAFTSWRDVPVQHRIRVFFKYQALIRDNMDKIAAIITKEQGKALADARGDVFRGLGEFQLGCQRSFTLHRVVT